MNKYEKDFEDIIITRCPHCGSYLEVTNEVLGIKTNREYKMEHRDLLLAIATKWWMKPKTCWQCNKEYTPMKRQMRMTRFVFDAFRTVKM